MRTLVGLLLVTLAWSLAGAAPRDPASKARLLRVVEIVDDLAVNESTSGQLVPVLSRYYRDHARLDSELDDLGQRIARAQGPEQLDKLYDEEIDIQRRMLAVESRTVARLRQILPAAKAARARLMLRTPPAAMPVDEPTRSPDPPPAIQELPDSETPPSNPGPLFPPASKLGPCDPFAAMHGCARPPS
jgi:hypothetical protein